MRVSDTPLKDRLCKTKRGREVWQQERTILALTEMICQLMEDQGVSRPELARRLGKTDSWVTMFLDGRGKMNIRTISDVLTVLGMEFHAKSRPIAK